MFLYLYLPLTYYKKCSIEVFISFIITKYGIFYNNMLLFFTFGRHVLGKAYDLKYNNTHLLHSICSFKQRYIAGSAKFSTKPLSKLLTCILSVANTGLQSYCDTSYSRGGMNQMWILKKLERSVRIHTIQIPLLLH